MDNQGLDVIPNQTIRPDLLAELPPIYRVQQPLNHLTGQVS